MAQTAMKVVFARGRADDYAVYVGPTDWTDDDVRSHGGKLNEQESADVRAIMHKWGARYTGMAVTSDDLNLLHRR